MKVKPEGSAFPLPDGWENLPKDYEIEWSEKFNQYRSLLGKLPHSYRGLPAVVVYHPLQSKITISGLGWCTSGQYHRANGPAIIRFHPNGNIRLEMYVINGKRHRTAGPAIVKYDETGVIKETSFWNKDREFEPGPLQTNIWNLGDVL